MLRPAGNTGTHEVNSIRSEILRMPFRNLAPLHHRDVRIPSCHYCNQLVIGFAPRTRDCCVYQDDFGGVGQGIKNRYNVLLLESAIIAEVEYNWTIGCDSYIMGDDFK